MDRVVASDAKYRQLFGERDPAAPEDDPEFMTILRRLISGDVFHTGESRRPHPRTDHDPILKCFRNRIIELPVDRSIDDDAGVGSVHGLG